MAGRPRKRVVEEAVVEEVKVEEQPDMTDMFVSPIRQRVIVGMHTLRFEARVPQRVPKPIQHEMVTFGILPVEGEPPVKLEKEKVEVPSPHGKQRIELIDDAIQQLVDRNVATDFSAGGIPKIESLNKKLSFEITVKERDDRWKVNRQAAAEARQE